MSVEAIKQFLVTAILPILVGTASNWLLIHVHLFATFHITEATVAGDLTQLGVFAISAGLTWLASHKILLGAYQPSAKANHAAR